MRAGCRDQRWCGLNPVGQATVVLTNTSKLNIYFLLLLFLRLFLCRAGSAGDALAPSGWPDGPGIPRPMVRWVRLRQQCQSARQWQWVCL